MYSRISNHNEIPNMTRPPIYGVQLFDDLHYYLPDLLYNNNRFINIADVFQYINNAMRHHFDRYSAATAAARSQQEPRPTIMYYSNVSPAFRMLSEILHVSGGRVDGAEQQAPPPIPATPPNINIPTYNDLIRETSIGIVTQNMTDRMCVICHENMNAGTSVRIINHCQHMFHRECIDYWFSRSSSCPVCRYDIYSDEDDEDDESE
jgi:hypothetical protein